MGPGIHLKLYVQGTNTRNAENSGMLRLSRMNFISIVGELSSHRLSTHEMVFLCKAISNEF
jgi:hypothetical protein